MSDFRSFCLLVWCVVLPLLNLDPEAKQFEDILCRYSRCFWNLYKTFYKILVFFQLTLNRIIHNQVIAVWWWCNISAGKELVCILILPQCLQHDTHSDSLTKPQCYNSPSRNDMNLLLIVLCIPSYWFLSR